MEALLGKKMKMSQIWKNDRVVPVTVISVPENKVFLVRTTEKDGYDAIQVKTGRKAKEFKGKSDLGPGAEVAVSIFKEGDKVRVSGITKGRGFQGVVKRHGFGGGPQTHGQKNRLRAPGSIGSTAPQRVWKGRRMAGHMGMDRVTIKNLVVAEVDAENKLIYIRGAVPGPIGGTLEIVKVTTK
jgi:large subunit ribosomal protein L3